MVNHGLKGKSMYEAFVADCLQSENKTPLFAPLTKANLKTCKSANKSRKINANDRVIELRNVIFLPDVLL